MLIFIHLNGFAQTISRVSGTVFNDLNHNSHIWTAELPSDLQEGSHIIKTTTFDMLKRRYTAYQIFNIR